MDYYVQLYEPFSATLLGSFRIWSSAVFQSSFLNFTSRKNSSLVFYTVTFRSIARVRSLTQSSASHCHPKGADSNGERHTQGSVNQKKGSPWAKKKPIIACLSGTTKSASDVFLMTRCWDQIREVSPSTGYSANTNYDGGRLQHLWFVQYRFLECR